MKSGLEQTRRVRGIVSSKKSGARVDASRHPPPAALADVVETYWTGSWDLRGEPPHVTELISDPCVHLVYEWGDRGRSARVVGVWTHLWRRELADRGHVVGVKLRAGVASAVVAAPICAFNNVITPLTTVLPTAPKPTQIVGESGSQPDAFEVLSAWLLANAKAGPDHARAQTLVETIKGDPEITSVDVLAESSGIGLRTVQRLFREHVGPSPKLVIRRHRLQEVAVRLDRGESISLAGLAADLGYADQAHLTRDFKAMVGKTPTGFLAAAD